MLFHHATLIVIAAVYSFAYIGVIRAQEVSNQTLSLNNTTTPAGGTQTGDASSPGPPGVFSQPAAGGGTSKQMAPPFTGGTTQENTVLGPGENLTNINGLLGMGSQTQNNQTPAMNPESDGFSQTIVSTNPGSTCIFSVSFIVFH